MIACAAMIVRRTVRTFRALVDLPPDRRLPLAEEPALPHLPALPAESRSLTNHIPQHFHFRLACPDDRVGTVSSPRQLGRPLEI